jgi:hypothetical protein
LWQLDQIHPLNIQSKWKAPLAHWLWFSTRCRGAAPVIQMFRRNFV